MKRLTISRIIVSALFGLGVQAQTITNPPLAGPLPDWHTWTVAARDGTTTTRQLTQQVIDLLTGQVTNQTRTVIEVATGLNYQDASGIWQESQDAIALTPDGGAAAVEGPLKVHFSPAGLNDDAALTITAPGGQVLSARVQGVYLYDRQSGQSRLLAAPSSSAVAELLSPNQVIYRSAFNSDALQADLRYTYTKGGFESDVIITRQPKLSPQDCGFNPATTLLQVRHQWQNAPMPVSIREITVGQGGAAMPDQLINLGEMFFPPGAAFLTDGASSTDTNVPARISAAGSQSAPGRVPVGKEWQAGGGPGGSSLLIESVSWESLATNLASLPLMAQADGSPSTDYYASAVGEALIWPAGLSAAPGLLLDFNLVYIDTYYTNFTFQSYLWPTGPSYVVTGSADFFGTLTLQPNCVIKFSCGYGYNYSLTLYGPVACNGSQANPSVLTSYYDNQYGDPLASQYQAPAVGNVGTGLSFYYVTWGNPTLNGLVIRYATTAIEVQGSCSCSSGSPCFTATVENSELYDCTTGVYTDGLNVSIQNSAVKTVTTPLTTGGSCNYLNRGSFAPGYPPTSVSLTPCGAIIGPGDSVLFTGAVNTTFPATYQWFGSGGTFGQGQQIGSGNQALLLGNPGDGTQVSVVGGNPFGSAGRSSWSTVYVPADWDYLIANTNGKTPGIWTTMPYINPPPAMAWNPSSLIYGKTGFTAISQLNTWDFVWPNNGPGQIPVTALTARHGYTRGHGMGGTATNYYTVQNPMMTAWFCDAYNNNSLVPVNVLANIVRTNSPYDYTVLLFDRDLPSYMQMQVGNSPQGTTALLSAQPEAYNGVAGSVALYAPSTCVYNLPFIDWGDVLGDSGSAVMVPTTDNALVFIGGETTSGPCTQMQTDMDTLIGIGNAPPYSLGLNVNNYQMQWHATP